MEKPGNLIYIAYFNAGLRIFEDAAGKFNLSLVETQGAALVVSQFTLYADTHKGRRPSFIDAAPPELAAPLVACGCLKIAYDLALWRAFRKRPGH